MVIAALLGGLLGLERELRGKSAGIRTHMLLAMGAAVFGHGVGDRARAGAASIPAFFCINPGTHAH